MMSIIYISDTFQFSSELSYGLLCWTHDLRNKDSKPEVHRKPFKCILSEMRVQTPFMIIICYSLCNNLSCHDPNSTVCVSSRDLKVLLFTACTSHGPQKCYYHFVLLHCYWVDINRWLHFSGSQVYFPH